MDFDDLERAMAEAEAKAPPKAVASSGAAARLPLQRKLRCGLREGAKQKQGSVQTIVVRVLAGLSGETLCELRVQLSSRVHELKSQVAEEEGTPACEQRLLLGTKLLYDIEELGQLLRRAKLDDSDGLQKAWLGVEPLCLSMVRLAPGRAALLAELEGGRRNLWELPAELQEEPEFALAAVRRNTLSLKFASEGVRGNRDLMLAVVRERGEALRYALEEVRGDPEVVLAAVEQDPMLLQYSTEDIRADADIVLAAMRLDKRCIRFADEELLSDSDFRVAAEETGVFRDSAFQDLLWISSEAAKSLHEQGSCVFLDARSSTDFAVSHVLGAHAMPGHSTAKLTELEGTPAFRLALENPHHALVVYSDNGEEFSRCGHLARELRQSRKLRAYRVLRLTGGLNLWKKQGFPVEGDTRTMYAGRAVDPSELAELLGTVWNSPGVY